MAVIETVEAAMRTPDRRWRVEIVKRGKTRWYRIVNGDNMLDWLSIAAGGADLGRLA